MRTLILSARCLGRGLGLAPGHAHADVSMIAGGANLSVGVTSFKDRKFERVIRQHYDYSCGSAAVATLLTYHLERPTTEREAFDRMYELGDKERIQREGFSLYEMKLFLESLGYAADGFRIGFEKVASVGVPVIVMIELNVYKHFVLVKGVRDGWALVADPAFGLKKWKGPELEAALASDVIFAIHNADDVGREHFNVEGEWALLPEAPFMDALDRRSLATLSAMLPAFNEVY